MSFKTLTQIRSLQGAPNITNDDLLYIVDGATSKAATVSELLQFINNNIDLTNIDGNLYIVVNTELDDKPTLRYYDGKWQYSNDGIIYEDIGSGGGEGILLRSHYEITYKNMTRSIENDEVVYTYDFSNSDEGSTLNLFELFEVD